MLLSKPPASTVCFCDYLRHWTAVWTNNNVKITPKAYKESRGMGLKNPNVFLGSYRVISIRVQGSMDAQKRTEACLLRSKHSYRADLEMIHNREARAKARLYTGR